MSDDIDWVLRMFPTPTAISDDESQRYGQPNGILLFNVLLCSLHGGSLYVPLLHLSASFFSHFCKYGPTESKSVCTYLLNTF